MLFNTGHSNSIFVILQLDRRIIDNFEGWKYVRTKVITFVPAKAKACSLDELQSPPDGSGLMLNSTEAIDFNQYAVFTCPDDQVTDDGPLFKIKCLPNGQYQSRKWGACRERKVCEIRPPKPPTKYGLARDNTRGIKEFENATYACKDPNMVCDKYVNQNYWSCLNVILIRLCLGLRMESFELCAKREADGHKLKENMALIGQLANYETQMFVSQ